MPNMQAKDQCVQKWEWKDEQTEVTALQTQWLYVLPQFYNLLTQTVQWASEIQDLMESTTHYLC